MEPRWYQDECVNAWVKEATKKPDEHQLLVLPTGAGKTVVMAMIISLAIEWGIRVLVLARSRELVDQNRLTFDWCYPEHQGKTGSYCAGLGMRESDKQVVFASIQSVCNKAEQLGERRLVIIDEAHQIPANESSQYQTALAALRTLTDRVKILGLTASPYRQDGGVIFGENQQFDSVAYNVPLSVLIDEGYITKPKTLDVQSIELEGVKKTAGDFNKSQVEQRFLKRSLASEIKSAADSKACQSVLIFASGVSHAERLGRELEELGEKPRVVTGETMPLLRGMAIESFSQRKFKYLINVECLTTGFDAPCVDMIVVARATYSPGLFLQMVGRGFRRFEGKETCWVLDYGGNIERHGPINSDSYGIDTIKPPSDKTGEAPKRVCPKCFAIVHAAAKQCDRCGLDFPRRQKDFIASRRAILAEPTWLNVTDTTYSLHKGKNGKPKSLRVIYKCEDEFSPMGIRYVSEWMCFEHQNYAMRKAHEWWCKVSNERIPVIVEDVLQRIQDVGIAKTLKIEVKREGKYDRVLDRQLGEKPQSSI